MLCADLIDAMGSFGYKSFNAENAEELTLCIFRAAHQGCVYNLPLGSVFAVVARSVKKSGSLCDATRHSKNAST